MKRLVIIVLALLAILLIFGIFQRSLSLSSSGVSIVALDYWETKPLTIESFSTGLGTNMVLRNNLIGPVEVQLVNVTSGNISAVNDSKITISSGSVQTIGFPSLQCNRFTVYIKYLVVETSTTEEISGPFSC